MWLGARRAGTIANALGRNWMVTEQRKAGEGSMCGSPACQAGGRENELETLRNVSRPGTQRWSHPTAWGVGWGGGRSHAHIVGTQLPGTWLVAPRTVSLLQRSVSLLDEWDLGSLEFTSLWDGSLVIR